MKKLTTLRFCIQCTDQLSQQRGDFVYFTHRPFIAFSPVFGSSGDLFLWMKERGLTNGTVNDFEVYMEE